jgi:DNA-binding MarR family transcriptional regulator
MTKAKKAQAARRGSATRAALLDTLARVGREHSDATVLFHARLAAHLQLPPTDYKTISLLERLGPLTAGDVGKHTGLASASVTSLIDRLADKGFVERVADPDDRRRVRVAVRRDRLDGVRRQVPSPAKSLLALWNRYSDDELRTIADFLERNASRLRDETARVAEPVRRQAVTRNAP